MQQIEPENSEKIELEHRDKPKFMETFGNFGPSGFCCKEENGHTFNLNVCSKCLFPIETALEEITPLLTEKHDSESREYRWFKTNFLQCVFGHQYFNTEINLKKFLNRILHYNCRAFDWHVDGSHSYENQFLELWYNQVSDATKKPTTFQSIDLWQLQKISIEILMQQIEPENSEKIELEHRDKPKFMESFGNFGPSGFCCKEENRHSFNLNVCSKYLFPIETAMEEITPLLTEKHDSENRDDSKLKTFSAFLDINFLIQESN